MSKQTAVEWLVEQLKEYDFGTDDEYYLIKIPSWVLTEKEEQAKEMEKEQIMQSYSDGIGNGIAVGQEECSFESVADEVKYYEQTYGGKL
jgi:hypothetical protein